MTTQLILSTNDGWRRNRKETPSYTTGFSLLELLVVIAVIGVVSALLLPALSQAKERARRVYCQNNLRQLGIAMTLYADDYGRYPATSRFMFGGVGGSSEIISIWNARLLPYVGYDRDVFYCPSYPSRFKWTKEISKTSWPYYFPTNIAGNRPFCYAINEFGVATYGTLGIEKKPGLSRTTSEIAEPADMIAVGEDTVPVAFGIKTNKVGGWGKFTLGYSFGMKHETARIGKEHQEGCNMVFLDGHVEWDKWWRWIEANERATRRWNYDNQPHPEFWDR